MTLMCFRLEYLDRNKPGGEVQEPTYRMSLPDVSTYKDVHEGIVYKVCHRQKVEDIQVYQGIYYRELSDSCGIVYYNTPEEVLSLAYRLERGEPRYSVASYAGQGLDQAEMQQAMKDWLDTRDKIQVTKAAGTGIDKADVRSVIHL